MQRVSIADFLIFGAFIIKKNGKFIFITVFNKVHTALPLKNCQKIISYNFGWDLCVFTNLLHGYAVIGAVSIIHAGRQQ